MSLATCNQLELDFMPNYETLHQITSHAKLPRLFLQPERSGDIKPHLSRRNRVAGTSSDHPAPLRGQIDLSLWTTTLTILHANQASPLQATDLRLIK